MATFMDLLNQGVGQLNTPLGMLGTQLMANSGYQQGATGASRLGNAFVGAQQQAAQLQQLQQQQQLRQVQGQELALRQAEAQRQNQVRAATAQYLKDNPNAMNGSPLGQAVMAAGGDPKDAVELSKLGPQAPAMAKMPWTRERPNADGTTTHMEYDLNAGDYKPVSTYKTPTMINAEQNVAKTDLDLKYKPLEFEQSQQRADATTSTAQTAQQKLELQQQKAQREADASVFKKRFDRQEFKNQYLGAASQFDEVADLADDIAKDPALKSLYGPNGYIPPVAGSDAANLQTKIDRLRSKGGLVELTKLKQQGVSLTPVSNTDLSNAQNAFANFDKMQSDAAAQASFAGAAASMRKAKAEAAQRFNDYDSLFETPSAGTAKSSGPATISDDAGYNALPSGAQFIAPDGSLRRKP